MIEVVNSRTKEQLLPTDTKPESDRNEGVLEIWKLNCFTREMFDYEDNKIDLLIDNLKNF